MYGGISNVRSLKQRYFFYASAAKQKLPAKKKQGMLSVGCLVMAILQFPQKHYGNDLLFLTSRTFSDFPV